MSFRIQKVAVLGSGVMGSGIACHFANIGLDVTLLDIVPFNLSDEEKKDKAKRNSIVDGSLKAATKSKPASLYNKSFVNRIKTGNFDDDFELIEDADWIIEVIIENLDIKKQTFERVEKHRKAGSLVTSNTSSIPIKMLVEGRSDDFKAHFCGTHFFNPPRYLRLFEVIPHETTSQKVVDFFMDYADRFLGKQTVLCKDTPAFIGNRIGVMSTMKMFELTEKHNFKIEEVDSFCGSIIARPKTAQFRLQDLVGIDTGNKVGKFVSENASDEFFDKLKGKEMPKYLQFLEENKFFGNKTKKGFYEKTSKKDEKGKTIINALNLKTLQYQPSIKARLDVVGKAKKIELMDKRLQTLIEGDDKVNLFLKEYFASLFAYTSNRIPEISDYIYSVDDAMKTGYAWDYGVFEYWDLIGLAKGIEIAEANGDKVADWINEMKAAGCTSFYKYEDGKRKCYNIKSKSYQALPNSEGIIILDAIRDKTPIIKNSEATVHDIGDGVMCVEFQSKSNAIGEGIGNAIHEAIVKAETENWKGVVIGNNAKNFTVGANLMNIGMMAMQKNWDALDKAVNDFQQLTMFCRTSKVPTVVATQGYVFGGGCEISMHCNGGVFAAESYIGLVEAGVGLIPGGGGTKEMAVRASNKFFAGDVQIPTLIKHFTPVGQAQVATSAYEALEIGLLDASKDEVIVNAPRNIYRAKQKVLELAKNYVAPTPRTDIEVLGRSGMAVLQTAINEFVLGKYISEYDAEIGKAIAYVICGGDLTGKQKVSEQYLLDIEREQFLKLLGNQKTIDRIQHILMYNKPLRN